MIKLRTCVKCRSKLQQIALVRLKIKNGLLIEWDGNGRSFYLCEKCISNPECIKSIYKINKMQDSHISSKDLLAVKLKEIFDKWQKKK